MPGRYEPENARSEPAEARAELPSLPRRGSTLAVALAVLWLAGSSAAQQPVERPMARVEVPAGEEQALLELAASGEASAELRADPSFRVIETVARWAKGWEQQDPDRYLASYAEGFRPSSGASRSAWEATRRQRILAPSSIRLTLLDLQVVVEGETATASFRQIYESDRFGDVVRKTLQLRQTDAGWRIQREDAVAVRSSP